MHWQFVFNRWRIDAVRCCFFDSATNTTRNAVLLIYIRRWLATKALASFALRLASVYMPLANKCGAAAKVLALEPGGQSDCRGVRKTAT